MDVRGLGRLLVPTSKSLTPPPLRPLPLNVIRHYACHDVSNISGPKITHSAVTVVDQFATAPIPGFPDEQERACREDQEGVRQHEIDEAGGSSSDCTVARAVDERERIGDDGRQA
jgi:hypothetical protein